jgi:hypothetical protein
VILQNRGQNGRNTINILLVTYWHNHAIQTGSSLQLIYHIWTVYNVKIKLQMIPGVLQTEIVRKAHMTAVKET